MSLSKNYYLVRSNRGIPLDDNVVGMGWDDIHFCDFDNAEEIINEIVNVNGWNIGRRSNQIRRFKGIKKLDILVVPWWGAVVIGIATGEEKFDERYYGCDACNQQKVDFIRQADGKIKFFPRSEFSEAFQKRLKIRMTITDLNQFADEIKKYLTDSNDYSWVNDYQEKIKVSEQFFQEKVIEKIRKGDTHLKTGGVGLENLVKELLIIDGFDADVLPKKQFPSNADADIEAIRENNFGTTEQLLVQVKHHDYNTNMWGQEQLLKIKEVLPNDYKTHQLVLLTSGNINDTDRMEAEKNNIIIIDGEKLAEWIFNSIENLSDKTKSELGIIEVPQLTSIKTKKIS